MGSILAVTTGFVGGMMGYFCGSKVGNAVYNIEKKVCVTTKNIAKVDISRTKSTSRTIARVFNF